MDFALQSLDGSLWHHPWKVQLKKVFLWIFPIVRQLLKIPAWSVVGRRYAVMNAVKCLVSCVSVEKKNTKLPTTKVNIYYPFIFFSTKGITSDSCKLDMLLFNTILTLVCIAGWLFRERTCSIGSCTGYKSCPYCLILRGGNLPQNSCDDNRRCVYQGTWLQRLSGAARRSLCCSKKHGHGSLVGSRQIGDDVMTAACVKGTIEKRKRVEWSRKNCICNIALKRVRWKLTSKVE